MIIKNTTVREIALNTSEYDFFVNNDAVDEDLYELPVISGSDLVWGHNIVRCAISGNRKDIFCRYIAASPEECLVTALKAENRKDSYTWFEKEQILEFIRKNSIDEEKTEVLKLIQEVGSFIPNTDKFSSLDSYLKEIVNDNIIDLKTAVRLSLFDDEIIGKIVEIIRDFSFSRKRLFINYIVELYKKGDRDRVDIASLLNNASEADDPFGYIAACRYPSLKSLEKDFSDYTDKYLKGSGIQLKSPPYFEGGGYSVQFSFKSKKQLSRIIERLEKVRETSDDIFRLL